MNKQLSLDLRTYAQGFGVWRPIIIGYLYCLISLSLVRVFLSLWHFDRIDNLSSFLYILLQGLRVDISTISAFIFFPAILTPLLSINLRSAQIFSSMCKLYLLAIFIVMLFMELATPTFIGQFDTRPNIWFIEYLRYPKEVGATLLASYKLPLASALIIVVLGAMLLKRSLFKVHLPSKSMNWKIALITTPIMFVVLFFSIRSSTGHRPLNPGTVAFTSDSLVNSLPLNSTYSALFALRGLLSDTKSSVSYGKMDRDTVIKEIQKSMYLDKSVFSDSAFPTRHRQEAVAKNLLAKNLIIVLEESLGAEFVGSLGGLPLTPNLDSLANEGLWFENMYATGTRSVRGIEAVVSGFLPTSAQSVVKRPASQNDFFTLGRTLSESGYETSFIYGGEANFDNMRAFFANNGFSKIIENKDFTSPTFEGAWGVSDEDLFAKADLYFESLAKNNQPFFSLVFTSSNHEPFEYPDKRIELYDQPKETVNNAVKYADYAVGKFIEQAKNAPWFDNTVILIVADHNSRVYGADFVPVERFHIPALILGADIPKRKVSHIASQIDLAPTLLSLININAIHPATGINLMREDIDKIPGRAIMQYDQVQAYLEEENIVVLLPRHEPQQFSYVNGQYLNVNNTDDALIKRALATAIWPNLAYSERLYQ